MKDDAALILLIRGLTQHEKRYLALHLKHVAQGRESHVLRMFRLLDKAGDMDEGSIRASLGTDALAKQWAVRKHQCYHALLRGLQAYRYEHSPAMRVRSGLDKVELLLERGLYGPALKQLQLTRTLAETYVQHGSLLDLLDLERRILRTTHPLGYLDALPRIEAHERRLMAIVEQEAEAVRIYDRLFAWVQVERRMEKATLAAQLEAFGERLERLAGVAVPVFSTRSTLLHAQALWHQMHGDYAGMLAAYTQALALWDAHPKLLEAWPERHARAQGAWLNALLAAGQIGDHLPDIRRLRRLPIQELADRARTVFQSYNLELLWLMDQRDEAAAMRFLEGFEEKLPQLAPHLDALRLGSLCLNAMIVCFRAGWHGAVLRWLSRMPETVRQERANVVFRSADLLGLLSACEVGEFALAESKLAALGRRVRGADADWEFGRIVVLWMTKILPLWGTKDMAGLRARIGAELQALAERTLPVPLVLDLVLAWTGGSKAAPGKR